MSHDLDAGAYALLREAKRVAVKAAGESLDASAFIATLCRCRWRTLPERLSTSRSAAFCYGFPVKKGARQRLDHLRRANADQYADAVFRLKAADGRAAGAVLKEWAGDSYVATIRVELGADEHLILLRAKTQDLLGILEQKKAAAAYQGSSWIELIDADYPDWRLVARATGARRTLSGSMSTWSGSVAELVPGDKLRALSVPGVFAGDAVPSVSVPDSIHQLLHIDAPDPASYPDASHYHFFFLDGIAVVGGHTAIEPTSEIQWEVWPASSFPHEGLIFDELRPFVSSQHLHEQFTAVLMMKCPSLATLYPERTEVEGRRQEARRFCVLLDALGISQARVVADLVVAATSPGGFAVAWRGEQSSFAYRTLTSHPPSPGIAVTAATLQDICRVVGAVFPSKGQRSRRLIAHLQRALDAVALGQSAAGPEFGLVFLWAGIESLISPDKSEVRINVSLALLGLHHGELNDRVRFFEDAKRSYTVRSAIVHAFDLPDDLTLRRASAFAKRCFKKAAKTAFRACADDPTVEKDTFSQCLRNRAIE